MASQVIAESDDMIQRGIAAQNEFRFDDASLSFWRALSCIDASPDLKERRDRSVQLASFFRKATHEDLALLAISEAIRLDEKLNDNAALINHLIYYGNIHMRLGNTDEAKATFADVIERCLEIENYGNAASASTNLAALTANSGDGAGAIKLLRNSLQYLAKKPFPDTEFITHVAMIQTVAVHDGDPALAVESGIAIGKSFSERVTDNLRQQLVQPLQTAVESYLKKKPQPNPEAWKKENLAWIYSN
jgi:tetratricopeptide (TPR) repeat protein